MSKRIAFINFLETVTSFIRNNATAARVWILQDRDGTLADDTDLATTAAAANTYSDSLVSTTITAAQNYTMSALPDANYQLVLSDAVPLIKFLTLNSSSPRTITLPNDATEAIPVGKVPIAILNLGTADITVVAQAPAAVVNFSTVYTIPPLSMATVFKRAANTWRLENVTLGVPTSRTIAGLSLASDITAAALNTALGGWTKVVTTTDLTLWATCACMALPKERSSLADTSASISR